jgi:hypothetical protein
MERQPCLFLDDMSDLRSRELNSFVTTGLWRARVLGKSQTVCVPVEAQVFITGINLDIGRDLARRAAVCDLFHPGDALDREFSLPITDEWLLQPNVRAKFLAALWAGVRHWRDSGLDLSRGSARPSFESYTKLVGSIVAAFGMREPFDVVEVAVDKEGEAIKALLQAAAALVYPDDEGPEAETEAACRERLALTGVLSLEIEGGAANETPPYADFDTTQLLSIAERIGLVDVILPGKYNGEKGEKRALGRKLAVWRGRELVDKAGRKFEFGKRDGSQGAIYTSAFWRSDRSPAPLE